MVSFQRPSLQPIPAPLYRAAHGSLLARPAPLLSRTAFLWETRTGIGRPMRAQAALCSIMEVGSGRKQPPRDAAMSRSRMRSAGWQSSGNRTSRPLPLELAAKTTQGQPATPASAARLTSPAPFVEVLCHVRDGLPRISFSAAFVTPLGLAVERGDRRTEKQRR